RLPSRTVAMFDILREEYADFRAALKRDARLPPDYDDWRSRNAAIEAAHRTDGSSPKQVTVHFAEFSAFSRRLNLKPGYALLQIYANFAATEKGEPQ